MPRIYLKQKPFLVSNINLGGAEHSLVTRGENMQFTVVKIPTKTGLSYTFAWFQKQLNGALIQSGAGTLATNQTTEQYLDIPLGLTAFPVTPGNDFLFIFQVSDGGVTQELINTRFEVAGDSTAPTSPNILVNVGQRDVSFEPLDSTQATAFNFGGSGLDIGFNIDLTKSVIWTINGQEQPSSELVYVATGKVRLASNLTAVASGDRLRIIFFNQ